MSINRNYTKAKPKQENAADLGTINITVFTNDDGRLNKHHYWDNDDFATDSQTFLSRGSYNTVALPFGGDAYAALTSMKELLAGLNSNQALALGAHKDGLKTGTVASVRRASQNDVTRTLANFAFKPGRDGMLLLDGDDGMDLRAKLIKLWPGFANIAALVRPSSSWGVHNVVNGKEKPSAGEHVYVPISDQSKAKLVLDAFVRLSWCKGHGRLRISRRGAVLIRGVVDAGVGSPERLIYEGPSTADFPVELRERPISVYKGKVLDVDEFLAYADREAPQELYEQRVAEAKNDPTFVARKQATRAKWGAEYVAKRVAEGATEAQAQREARHIGSQTLLGSVVFETRDDRRVTIGEILFNPEKWIGEVGLDPVEPNPREITKARVMEPNAYGQIGIFSYKNGGTFYHLKHDAASIARGFETRFSAADKDAYEAFLFAMTLSDDVLDRTERTELCNRAAAHFKCRRNDIRGDLRARKKAEKTIRTEERSRGETRALIIHDPARHAESVEAVARILGVRQSPLIFDYGGLLSVIDSVAVPKSTCRRWTIAPLTYARASLVLNRNVAFRERAPDGSLADIAPPRNVVEGFLTNDLKTLPPLYAIRSIPPISLSGETLRTEAGYADGIFYDGTCGTIAVPAKPGLAEAKAAAKFIFETVLCEFVFDSEVDEAATLALLLTLSSRSDYDTAPAFVIDAPAPATGKGKLAKALVRIATGTDAPAENFDNDNVPEVRKVFTTNIRAGEQVTLFDNVVSMIGNGILDAVLTSATYGDRVLGTNDKFRGDQCMTIIFTANGATVARDTARRSLRIFLNAKGYEDPRDRPIRNESLIETIAERRGELVSAVLTILRAHRLAGLPGESKLASFESWAKYVGRCVQWVSGIDPVTSQRHFIETESERIAIRAVYLWWERSFGEEPVSASRARQAWFCDEEPRHLPHELRTFHEHLRALCGERMLTKPFGKMMARLVNQQVNGRIFVRDYDAGNNARYRLVAVDDRPINSSPLVDVSKDDPPPSGDMRY